MGCGSESVELTVQPVIEGLFMNPDATLSKPKHLKFRRRFAEIIGFAKAHTQNFETCSAV